MRYYEISVDGETRWTSLFPDGSPNRQAQNIEMDVLVYQGQAAYGNSTLTIQGPHLKELFDANALYTKTITVKAGMTKGLPLARPSQAGVLFTGQVFQSFANWVGTEMELSLILAPTPHTIYNPGNFTFVWKKGQTLNDALIQTISKAMPGYTIESNISDQLVANADHAGVYFTLDELAYAIQDWTQAYFSSLGSPYMGVQIGVSRGTVVINDGTQPPGATIQIDFFDFIGQPTWIGVNRLQFITVMRGDISINTVVKMPQGIEAVPGFITTTSESMPSQTRYQSTFRGPFHVISVRHVGNFRASSGEMWVSIFEAVPSQVNNG